MLKLLLFFAKSLAKEPCSIQKEIINRSSKRRGQWDYNNLELIEMYEHLDSICKKRTRPGTINPSQFFTLMKYPTSSLNFLNGRKVPFNDIEKFKSEVNSK